VTSRWIYLAGSVKRLEGSKGKCKEGSREDPNQFWSYGVEDWMQDGGLALGERRTEVNLAHGAWSVVSIMDDGEAEAVEHRENPRHAIDLSYPAKVML
jgi:hypothetical protein